MEYVTLVVDEKTKQSIIDYYKEHEVKNNNPHALFVAKTDGVTITVYKTNKVLFQGKNAETEARIFTASSTFRSSQNDSVMSLQPSIGSDEVGTGDYFGPVVVCAAYVDKKTSQELRSLGLRDSKTLSDERIHAVAPILISRLPHSLLVVRNEQYNELVEGGMGLNEIKARLHYEAINQLRKKINRYEVPVVIDQFCSVTQFIRYTQDESFVQNVMFVTKAENQFLSVACASIIARYHFLQELKKLSDWVDTPLQKGASHLVDEQGKQLVERYGLEILRKVAKLHFKNTEKIKKL